MDTYTPYIAVSTTGDLDRSQYDLKTSVETLQENERCAKWTIKGNPAISVEEARKSNLIPKYSTVLFKDNSNHTCRETMLYFFDRTISSTGYTNLLRYPQIFAVFSITSVRSKSIEKFKEAYLSGFRILPFEIIINGQWASLNMQPGAAHPGLQRDLCKFSLMLWLMKSNTIMDSVVRSFDDYKPNFYWELSKQFLLNKSWGNAYNSNLAISLFCYALSKDVWSMSTYHTNGPSSAGIYGSRTSTLISFIEDMFIPTLPKVSSVQNGMFYIDNNRDFVSGFDRILKLLRLEKNSKGLEEEWELISTE
jgi:hypothetical protein